MIMIGSSHYRIPCEKVSADMFDHCVFRSTYATTVRDSKRARERDFLKAVSLHHT